MGIISPESNRERILIFGPPGVGKSRCYIDIYNRIDGDMYVIDSDVAVERMFRDVDQSRLSYNEATDYEEAANAMTDYVKQAVEGDWIVIDLLTPTWAWVQDYWAMKKGKTKANTDLALWMPMDNKDYDWVTINRMYNNFLRPIMKTPAHIMVITEETDVMDGKFEGDTDRLFKEFGMKPRGNKRVPHMFHECIHLGMKNFKTETLYNITAAKERFGRECFWNQENFTDQSFVDEYLIGVAGWTEDTPKKRRRKS